MLINIASRWTLNSCLIICFTATSSTGEFGWLDHFVDYIKKDSNNFQALMLLHQNQENEANQFEIIARKISRNVPTLRMDMKTTTKVPLLKSSGTTLIIIIYLAKLNLFQMSRTVGFISKQFKPKRLPRCLLVLRNEENYAYLKLLRFMSSNGFLDATIVELADDVNPKNQFFSLSHDVPMIHQFYPFANTYNRMLFSPNICWFPEKTGNLNGYKMRVGVMHSPPSTFIERNRTGNVTSIYGSDIRLTEMISREMNFRIVWVAPKDNLWRSSSFADKNSTALMNLLWKHEIQMIGVEEGRYDSSNEDLFQFSRGTRVVKLVLVVPICYKQPTATLIRWRIANVAVLVGLLLLTWILSRMLHFDKNSWNLDQLVRIFLGAPALHEPQKLIERIIFGSVILSCFMHSSSIYSAVTDIYLQSETEYEYDTIQDVIHSTLEPLIDHSYYLTLSRANEQNINLLLRKSKEEVVLDEICSQQLRHNKNQACLQRDDIARWLLQKDFDIHGRPFAKVVDEPLKVSVTGWVLEAGSPYVTRFDKVLLRLVQSGIVARWQHVRENGTSIVLITEQFNEERIINSVLRKFTCVLLSGHAFATIVFFCEAFLGHLAKRANRVRKL